MASEMAESVDVRNINERRKSQASPLPGLCFMAVKIENKVCRDRKKCTLSSKGGIKARKGKKGLVWDYLEANG